MIVVDASVVLQWLLETPSADARTVLERHVDGRDVVVAPELLCYEVGHVLVRKTPLSEPDTAELFDHFLALDIETYSLGADEYRAAMKLARRHRLSVYDACYVALALGLGVNLITADRRLARATATLDVVRAI